MNNNSNNNKKKKTNTRQKWRVKQNRNKLLYGKGIRKITYFSTRLANLAFVLISIPVKSSVWNQLIFSAENKKWKIIEGISSTAVSQFLNSFPLLYILLYRSLSHLLCQLILLSSSLAKVFCLLAFYHLFKMQVMHVKLTFCYNFCVPIWKQAAWRTIMFGSLQNLQELFHFFFFEFSWVWLSHIFDILVYLYFHKSRSFIIFLNAYENSDIMHKCVLQLFMKKYVKKKTPKKTPNTPEHD